jgi:CheY-like chemotaxis protein
MAAQLLQNFKHPDLVVIDSNLPQLDGYSVFLVGSTRERHNDEAWSVLLHF